MNGEELMKDFRKACHLIANFPPLEEKLVG
jgi:hypothetical protein